MLRTYSVMVALREKKLTGEWRFQLTPWNLRFAVFNTSGNKGVKIIKPWANRLVKGDFDQNVGHC